MNKQNRKRIPDTRNNRLMVASGEGRWGEVCKNGEGIKKYRLVVTTSLGGVHFSIGNIVNSVIVTMYVARWVPDLLG